MELCKILIVDDEILIRQGIKHYVNWEQEGFQIVGEASNGKEALAMIEDLHPHIVLTDIVMPVMDGDELTRVIKTVQPEIEVVVLSSFGEFDYVRSTFQSGVADYILKPKLETQALLNVLQKTALKIPSLQLRSNTMEIALTIDQTIDRMMASYEVSCDKTVVQAVFPYDGYCLLGADLKHFQSVYGPEANRLIPLIEAEIRGKLPWAAFRTIEVRPDRAVFLLNADSKRMTEMNQALAAIAASASAAFPQTVLVQSELYDDFTETGTVYRDQISKLFQYGFYFPGRDLIVHQDMPSPAPQIEKFNLNRFTEGLKRGQFETAFGKLKEYVAALSSCYTTNVFEYKSFLSNIIFNITVLLGNMEYDVKELERDRYTYFNAINEARSAADAARHLFSFIGKAVVCIGESSSHQSNSNMNRLLEYIEQNYAEPLTLKEMARHFHFNPSYLSSYFVSHNGEGFVDYLNRIRTEKAAELLRGGTASISEISAKVGYSDHSYFCKVFKKTIGRSPSQYRRQYMK